MSNTSDRPVGIHFSSLMLVLLTAAVLFITAVCAAFSAAYPKQIDAMLTAHSQTTPLANPPLCISGDAVTDVISASDLAQIGTAVPAVRYHTATDDGTNLLLTAMDGNALADAFFLTDGRMPQTAEECIAVALWPTAAPEIGSAISPLGEGGTVLASDYREPMCTLTVVGIAENTLSALAPITDREVGLLLYTASDAAWHTENAESCLLLTDCTVPDPYDAVQTLCRESAAIHTAFLAAEAEETLAALQAAAKEADNAVITHQITVQELENSLDTAELRVAEAEQNMMNAIAAVQAERQDFVSDMEYNEYYALRQVDLIPRRDRAEEGFAKQEEAIAQMNEVLHVAYAERDAILAELDRERAILEKLQADADYAGAAYEALASASGQTTAEPAWVITSGEDHDAHRRLTEHADGLHTKTARYAILTAILFAVITMTVYACSRRPLCPVSHFALLSAGVSIPALLFGGCILPALLFAHTYPALIGTLPIKTMSVETFIRIIPFLPLAVIAAALSAVIGCRLRHVIRKKA